jgi:magnesium-transporting ATPase (P-type)
MVYLIAGTFMYLFLGFIIFELCRENACHFPESKSKKYIVIKNTVIAKILISSGVGRDLKVNSWDFNKMSVVGLILYIVTVPAYLNFIVMDVMISSNSNRGIDNNFINLLHNIALGILGVTWVLHVLSLFIRKTLWYIRRRRLR